MTGLQTAPCHFAVIGLGIKIQVCFQQSDISVGYAGEGNHPYRIGL